MKIASTIILAITAICGFAYSQPSQVSSDTSSLVDQIRAKKIKDTLYTVQRSSQIQGEKHIAVITEKSTGQQITLATSEMFGLGTEIKMIDFNTETGIVTVDVNGKIVASELVNVGVFTQSALVRDSFQSVKNKEYNDQNSDQNQEIMATMLAKAIALKEASLKRVENNTNVDAKDVSGILVDSDQSKEVKLRPKPDQR